MQRVHPGPQLWRRVVAAQRTLPRRIVGLRTLRREHGETVTRAQAFCEFMRQTLGNTVEYREMRATVERSRLCARRAFDALEEQIESDQAFIEEALGSADAPESL